MEGGGGLIFIRPFNDLEVEEVKNHLQPIQGKRVLLCQEDMMFLKEARDGRFFSKASRPGLGRALSSGLLSLVYLELWTPSKVGFFCLKWIKCIL